MRRRDVGQRQFNVEKRCTFQGWNSQRQTTSNQCCVYVDKNNVRQRRRHFQRPVSNKSNKTNNFK